MEQFRLIGRCTRITLVKLAASLLICTSWAMFPQAQNISPGTHLVVGSGIGVHSINDMTMQAAGILDVQGTLILKRNLMNQNSSASTLGTGLIELSGSTSQTVSGRNIFQDLRISNAAGVVITGNTRVNGALKLKAGIVTLDTNYILLGPLATDSGGSATAMVVVTGTGEFRKEFASAASFTYPVGDNTGIPEYSPATLNFTSGTFASGNNYAGIKLVNSKYPNDSIAGSYLNRYWTVSQTGITSFNCNATFKYNYPADVTGTESALYCTRLAQDPWSSFSVANTGTHELTASGLSSISTFTGSKAGMDVALTAYLEGPFLSGAMTTTLRTLGLIPLTQPYNTAPWNYAGPETVASIPAGVVDWILIELRQAAAPASATSASILKRRAAFIKSDGTIVDLNGSDPIRFYNTALTSNLYPVVWHRNHLPIMANIAVTKDGTGKYLYDFSSGTGQIYGTGKVQLGSLWGMVTANADGTGIINAINNNDLVTWQANFAQINYNKADFDMTGQVNNLDLLKWQQNFAKQSSVPN